MPTNWQFWANVGSGVAGLLIIFFAARAKRNLRGRPLDQQTRLLIMLMGATLVVMSVSMALNDSGWRFLYDSVVQGILALFSVFLIGITVSIVVERRNYARAIATQIAQDSQETTEEL